MSYQKTPQPINDIKVCWSRKDTGRDRTADIDGYSEYRFSFNDGTSIVAKAAQYQGVSNASCWQKELFTTRAYMTKVEVWHLKGQDVVIIYAEPDNDIKEQLKT